MYLSQEGPHPEKSSSICTKYVNWARETSVISMMNYQIHIQTHHSNKSTMKSFHLPYKEATDAPRACTPGSFISIEFRVNLVVLQKTGLTHTGRYISRASCPYTVWTGIRLQFTSSNQIAHMDLRFWRTTFATCQRRSRETSDYDAYMTFKIEKEGRRIG